MLMFDLFRKGRHIDQYNTMEGFILKEKVHADSVSDYLRRVFIDPMKNIRAQQGEVPSVISQKGLRIDLPLPKQKATAVSEIVSGAKEVTKKKRPGVMSDKLEAIIQKSPTT